MTLVTDLKNDYYHSGTYLVRELGSTKIPRLNLEVKMGKIHYERLEQFQVFETNALKGTKSEIFPPKDVFVGETLNISLQNRMIEITPQFSIEVFMRKDLVEIYVKVEYKENELLSTNEQD